MMTTTININDSYNGNDNDDINNGNDYENNYTINNNSYNCSNSNMNALIKRYEVLQYIISQSCNSLLFKIQHV